MQYLYELLSQHLNEINNPQRDEVDELMTILAGCGFQPLRLGTKLTNQQITGMEEVNTAFSSLLYTNKQGTLYIKNILVIGKRVLGQRNAERKKDLLQKKGRHQAEVKHLSFSVLILL